MLKTPFFARVHIYGKAIYGSSLYDYEDLHFFEHFDTEDECVNALIEMYRERKEITKIDVNVYSAISYHFDGNIEAKASLLKLAKTYCYIR